MKTAQQYSFGMNTKLFRERFLAESRRYFLMPESLLSALLRDCANHSDPQPASSSALATCPKKLEA
jgi:hypothetical protein